MRPLLTHYLRLVSALLGAISLLLFTAYAAAGEAPIQSVTLYPGSATVERCVQVSPGMTQVEITGLMANFSTDSVRLQADAGIQVGQVVTRDLPRADNPNPDVARLEREIQALQDQLAPIEADYKSAQLVHAYLERLGSGGGSSERSAPLDPKSVQGTLEAIRKGAADALQRMHDSEVKKRPLARQLDVLQRELARRKASTRDSRVMTVQVAAKQAGRLILSYQVGGAGWKPAYRASLDSTASTVELERMATITQKTGEDWRNVKLRLSTGQPSLAAQAPEPSSWVLDYHPPQPVAPTLRFAAPPAPPPPPIVSLRARAPGAPVVEEAVEEELAPVVETQATFASVFEVPAQVTLAPDGREISVGLSKQLLPVRQRIRIAPREQGDAAVVTVETARPDGVWLPGQVQLRRDGSHVGALEWHPQDSDKLELAFGRDPLTRVVVEHDNDVSGGVGVFNRANERRIVDTYNVTSYHRQPIEILLLEPTPVSQSDKVRVKIKLDPEPGIKEWQERRGLVGWERTLKPNETAQFKVDYTIEYPKEGHVQGLP